MEYVIHGPKLGIADSVPRISQTEAFIQEGSENVIERYETYQSMRGRLAEFYDITNSAQIAAPTDVFEITGINTGTKTITIDGDHSAGNTALAVGDTIRINGHSTTANNVEYTVASLPTTATIVTTEAISNGDTAGNVFVGATPIIEYYRHIVKGTNAEHLVFGTAYNLFLWAHAARTMTVKHTCGSVCTRWEIVGHKDDIYATNNVDKILWYDTSNMSNNFVVCDDDASGLQVNTAATLYITKAKHMFSFEGYLFVGNLTYSDGNVYPYRIAHSTYDTAGASIDFICDGTGDATYKDFLNTPAHMRGFGRWGNNIIVATGDEPKHSRMYRGWLTTSEIAFAWQEEKLKVGCASADTIVNSKDGRMFFLATDYTIRELNTARPINSLLDKQIRLINVGAWEYAQATFIDQYNMIALAIPTDSSTTNNKLVLINVDKGSIYVLNIPVRAFGDFTQQTVWTYDTLPFSTYEEWGAEWLIYDTQTNVAGFVYDICSDYSGYTWDLFRANKDAGNDITAKLIFGTSLGAGETLNRFKRLNNGIDFYFKREAVGNVTINVKRDNEPGWIAVGTASLVDASNKEFICVHVPCDIRAKHFQILLTSTSYFEFIAAFFRNFQVGSYR